MTSKRATTPQLEYASSPRDWKPRAEQRGGIKWLLQYAAAGLFADPGAGKTSIVLAAFKILKREKIARRMLVIAPLRVCHEVWPVEVEDWKDFADLRVAVLHGSKKEAMLDSDADIFVINPDGLPWLLADGSSRLDKIDADILVVDESSKFKYTNTRRFKLLKPHLSSFRRRIILTGTPNPNGYMDLFGQIYLLDLGHALGRYITHYRMTYFDQTGYGGYTYVLKKDADKAIQAAISPYIYRIDMSESKEVPPVLDNVIRIELPAKARKLYDQMEEQFMVELENGAAVMSPNAGGALSRCAQIANGGLYYDVPNDAVGRLMVGASSRASALVHDEKTEAVADLVEELQGSSPVLVAIEFDHDLLRLQSRFGRDLPFIKGGVSIARTREIIERWNAGKIPLLAAHPAAMGHGLNMQKSSCRHLVWYGVTWDLEMYEQMIRRIRRPGNKAADIINHLIVARNTVDEAKLRALRRKDKDQRGLLDALRSYAKQRQIRSGSRTK